jgi:hypothetical protein
MTTEEKFGPRLVSILILIAVILLGGNASIFYFQSLQKTDGAIIDAAGRNRMLSQRIGFYSEMVADGHKENQAPLASFIDLHEKSFKALKNGGVAPGIAEDRVLPPTQPDIMPTVLEAETLWTQYKEHAETIANGKIYIDEQLNPDILRALTFLEEQSPEMLRLNDNMVKAYVKMNDGKQTLVIHSLFSGSAIGVLFLLLAAYVIKKLVTSVEKARENLILQNQKLSAATKHAKNALKESRKSKTESQELTGHMTGRELKMIELKKEIRELELKLTEKNK